MQSSYKATEIQVPLVLMEQPCFNFPPEKKVTIEHLILPMTASFLHSPSRIYVSF